MSRFIKVIIDISSKEFRNISYVPQIINLYDRFSRYLTDDYFQGKYDSSVDAVIDLIKKTSPYFWVIVDKKNNNFCGFVFLDNFCGSKDKYHSAEITTCFDPKYWGTYTRFCAKKFIKYCFKKYKFKKIKACIFPQNFKVKSILKFSGFKKEAILKAETYKNSVPQDVEVFSIIRK